MSTRTAHKRSAPSHGGDPSSSTAPTHAAKKTRFVDPSDDPVNFAEQVDSALENPSRKGKVKNEGYESDSSDDGEGVVFSRKKAADALDDDDDMFASAEKRDDAADGSSTKKEEKYMRLGDIEGQEFGVDSQSDDDDGDDEPEDEDDAERRKKAGMGFEVSSFNMREEMEEGKFTEDGSYVRTYDVHAVHDRWMEGLDEREIKLAKKRKKDQERKQKETMKAEEMELEQSGGKGEMEKQLLAMLKKGETVLEALQRLGSLKKREASSKSKQYEKSNTDNDEAMKVDKQPKAASDIEQITHLASNIMSLGDTDIYSKTYEELVRDVRAQGNVDPSWDPPSADIRYEYKWDAPGGGYPDGIFGPFNEDMMKTWFTASYFGPSGEKIKVRKTGGHWGEWDEVVM